MIDVVGLLLAAIGVGLVVLALLGWIITRRDRR